MLVMMVPGITSYQALPAVQPVATWVAPATVVAPGWANSSTTFIPAAAAGVATGDVGNAGILDALAALVFGEQPQAVMMTVAPAVAQAAPSAAVAAPASTPRQAIAGLRRATGKAVRSVATGAKRVGTELWAGVRNPRQVHVTQVPSKFNPNPAAGNRDCGPASVVMALRLVGASIPGIAATAAPQKLINRVRVLAGNADSTNSTSNRELEQALSAAGTATTELTSADQVKQQVLAGHPVILNGNPRNPGAYGPTFTATQMTPYDGAHWIVVSGFDKSTGEFLINDPLSKVGVVKVTAAQLEAYRGGSMGIAVEAQ